MTNEILINNRVNQVSGATDWLTFTDAGFPDLPETYTIVDLDADRATDGGHYRNLYGIRLGKIPDPDTLRIFEYLADSNSDSFDSDSEAGAEYTRAASWPPAAGEFATSGNGDIVYFHASQAGVQVAVLPYSFRATPLTVEKIREMAQEAISVSVISDMVDAAVDEAIAGPIQDAIDASSAALEALINKGYLAATSSTKTPAGSGHWHKLTGNSLALEPGEWVLGGDVEFNSTGGTAWQVKMVKWSSANGGDSGSEPASLTTIQAGRGKRRLATPNSDFDILQAPIVRVSIAVATTVYLVTYGDIAGTVSAGRVTAYLYAERIS